MKSFRIAVIPGDGVGVEVIEAAWIVLAAVAARHRFELTQDRYPSSCDYYLMPEDGIERLRSVDAIFLGAVVGGEGSRRWPLLYHHKQISAAIEGINRIWHSHLIDCKRSIFPALFRIPKPG